MPSICYPYCAIYTYLYFPNFFLKMLMLPFMGRDYFMQYLTILYGFLTYSYLCAES